MKRRFRLNQPDQGPDEDESPNPKKPRFDDSLGNAPFAHKEDAQQFNTIFGNIENSTLIRSLKVPSTINREIAFLACGEIRQCDNDDCEDGNNEIFVMLSEKANPALCTVEDLAFDNNGEQFFDVDDPYSFIYCKQCKNKGARCRRCHSFYFGPKHQQCYRCTLSICDFCGADCDNANCKVQYCIGGDVDSFTSGCGERSLYEHACAECGNEYAYCHGCVADFEGKRCSQCKKSVSRRNRKKKQTQRTKDDRIYGIAEVTKICPHCQSGVSGKYSKSDASDEDSGRKCEVCSVFICTDHCSEYGRFCCGVCETFCCNDCVKKGALQTCRRPECSAFLCTACELKCEPCWDYLMIHYPDLSESDIQNVLEGGNYSDYFSCNED